MEFEKKAKIMEFQTTSWKNHGILKFSFMLLLRFFARYMRNWSLSFQRIMENAARIMENSWENHGISFWEMSGNPVLGAVCFLCAVLMLLVGSFDTKPSMTLSMCKLL